MKRSLVKEIRKKYKKQIKFKEWNFKSLFFEPSFKGSIFIFFITVAIYFLANCIPFNEQNSNQAFNKIFDLFVNIHIGVFSLFFALAILIAGSIYSSNSDEKSRVLLQDSFIAPLFLFNVLILISFPVVKFLKKRILNFCTNYSKYFFRYNFIFENTFNANKQRQIN